MATREVLVEIAREHEALSKIEEALGEQERAIDLPFEWDAEAAALRLKNLSAQPSEGQIKLLPPGSRKGLEIRYVRPSEARVTGAPGGSGPDYRRGTLEGRRDRHDRPHRDGGLTMRLLNGPEGTIYAVREDGPPLRFLTISPVPRPGLVGMMPDVATYAEQLRAIADKLDEELAEEAKAIGDAGRGPTPANIDAPHVEGAKTTAGAGLSVGGFIERAGLSAVPRTLHGSP